MRRLVVLLGLVLLVLTARFGVSYADDQPAPQNQADTNDQANHELGFLMLGNHVFVFLHELGHALIDQLDLPIVGQEEDAVDEFATIALIAFARDEKTTPEDRDAFYGYAGAGAIAFLELWKALDKQIEGKTAKLPFWDEHALELKRVTNIMCLLYGSDPARFKEMADHFTMPEDRRNRCTFDYPRRDGAWTRLLTPHLQPTEGGRRPSGKLTVKYGEAGSQGSKDFEASLRQLQVFETFAEVVNTLFVLPNDITIWSRDCGEANAYWNPRDRTISMCYELMLHVGTLLSQSQQQADAPGAAPPADQPQAPAEPPPAADAGAQYFVAENGRPVGPMTLADLKARVANRQTKATDLVWKAGTPDWVAANQLAELRGDFGN